MPLPPFAGDRIMDRRTLLKKLLFFMPLLAKGDLLSSSKNGEQVKKKTKTEVDYGMGIQVEKCIGCARCVEACKVENNVPKEHTFYRTWVERYFIKKDHQVTVEMVDRGTNRYVSAAEEKDTLRSFFVPKLCNQCAKPACVQVCPVGATFQTEDGVILVDEKRCIGCRYCIHACPYGARYLHPVRHTADKCTFCYHRIKNNKLPVCVMVCPTQARVFGNLASPASPLTRIKRMKNIHVLKPYLNTEPKVFYTDLDGEVR
jgi:Fe-S-cluster-containing dehydrogenase component